MGQLRADMEVLAADINNQLASIQRQLFLVAGSVLRASESNHLTSNHGVAIHSWGNTDPIDRYNQLLIASDTESSGFPAKSVPLCASKAVMPKSDIWSDNLFSLTIEGGIYGRSGGESIIESAYRDRTNSANGHSSESTRGGKQQPEKGINEVQPEQTGIVEKLVEENGVVEKLVNDTGVVENLVEENGVVEKLVEENGVVEKVVEDTGVVEKLVEESGVVEKLLKDTGFVEKLVEDTGVVEKLMEETGAVGKLVEESGVVENLVKDTGVAEKLVEETGVVEKLVEETGVVEKLAEENVVVEKLVKDTGVVEKLVEDTGVVEKLVEDTGVVERKLQDTDVETDLLEKVGDEGRMGSMSVDNGSLHLKMTRLELALSDAHNRLQRQAELIKILENRDKQQRFVKETTKSPCEEPRVAMSRTVVSAALQPATMSDRLKYCDTSASLLDTVKLADRDQCSFQRNCRDQQGCVCCDGDACRLSRPVTGTECRFCISEAYPKHLHNLYSDLRTVQRLLLRGHSVQMESKRRVHLSASKQLTRRTSRHFGEAEIACLQASRLSHFSATSPPEVHAEIGSHSEEGLPQIKDENEAVLFREDDKLPEPHTMSANSKFVNQQDLCYFLPYRVDTSVSPLSSVASTDSVSLCDSPSYAMASFDCLQSFRDLEYCGMDMFRMADQEISVADITAHHPYERLWPARGRNAAPNGVQIGGTKLCSRPDREPRAPFSGPGLIQLAVAEGGGNNHPFHYCGNDGAQ